MPNLDLCINQNSNNKDTTTAKTISKFENCLLSIRDRYQKMIRPNLPHPIFSERYQNIIIFLEFD